MAYQTSSLLTLTTALSIASIGCGAEFTASTNGSAGTTAVGGMGGAGGTAGAGGMGGNAGMGGSGGNPIDGTPIPTHPSNNLQLTPTRAYLHWNDGELPTDTSISGYRLCYSDQGAAIENPNTCPMEITTSDRYHVIVPLITQAQYNWKVQTLYANNTTSLYSAVQSFSTDDSLLAWLRLDEGAGPTASDSSSMGNNGTLTNFDLGTAWIPGLLGSALLFNGTNSYVDLGAALNFDSSDSFSIEIWPRRNTGGNVQAIFSRMDFTDALARPGYRLSYTATDQIKVQLRNNDGAGNLIDLDTVDSYPVMPADPFQGITLTYNGSSQANGVALYSNAVLQALSINTDNLTGSMLSPAPAWIGAQVGIDFMTPDRVFDGPIDELAVFNTALSPAIILNNYCAIQAATGTPPPVACN